MNKVSGEESPNTNQVFFTKPTQKTKLEIVAALTMVGLTRLGRTKAGRAIDKSFVKVLQRTGRFIDRRVFTRLEFSALEMKPYFNEHWTIAAAKKRKLPKDFVTSNNFENLHSTVKEVLISIESQLKIQATGKARYRNFVKNTPKAFGLLKIGTAIVSIALIIYSGTESDRATMSDLKSIMNKRVKGFKEEGDVIERNFHKNVSLEDTQLLNIFEAYNKLVDELPVAERSNYIEAQELFLNNILKSRETDKIEKIIEGLNTLPLYELDSDKTISNKEFASRVGSLLTGLSVAITIGNGKIAECAIKKLIELGLPKTIVKKMTKELTKVTSAEVVRTASTQYVYKKQVKESTSEVLKHINIPTDSAIKLCKEEKKIAQSFANMVMGLVSKFLSIGTKCKIRAEGIEQFSRVGLRAGKEKTDGVEQHLTVAEIEVDVDKHLGPLRTQVDEIETYVSKYGDKTITRVDSASAMLSNLQCRVDTIKKDKLPKNRISELYKHLSQMPAVQSVLPSVIQGVV
ncbi:MAG: hypothetical protein H0W88_09145 [Parachlamydiaceae bacterium]|nr:hypothetical protein [Parachlamydiaceae bacterium]